MSLVDPASRPDSTARPALAERPGPRVLETVVSPFHAFYQDALEFHTQSRLRLARSEAEASRMARAALLLYLTAAEALAHQAAAELARPDLAAILRDPSRPMPLLDVWRLLPLVAAEGQPAANGPDAPPWPQFAELIALRDAWVFPGPPETRRAYYREREGSDHDFEPLQPHHIAAGLGIAPGQLVMPRTGLPRDPYAWRPCHVDTARAVIDSAIESLDRRLGGALTHNGRHRREPVRFLEAPRADDR